MDAQETCCASGMTLLKLDQEKTLSVAKSFVDNRPDKPSLHLKLFPYKPDDE
jgi:hypothetical protein